MSIRRRFCPAPLTVAGLLITALGTSGAGAHAATYYVDGVAGNDTNSGTSADFPWKSLSNVRNLDLNPGDTVFFKRGSVFADGGGLWFPVSDSGAAGQPVRLRNYGDTGQPLPTFTRKNASGQIQSGHIVQIEGQYMELDGLLFKDGNESAVYIAPAAHHNTVKDCEATAVGIGVWIDGTENLVTRSNLHDLKMVRNTPDVNGDDYGANGVLIRNARNEISYNTFRNCQAASYDYTIDGGAIELYARYGTLNATHIHHNFARDCDGFMEIGGERSQADQGILKCYNASVHHNVLYQNRGRFLYLHYSPNPTNTSANRFKIDIQELAADHNTIFETVSVAPPTVRQILMMNGVLNTGVLYFRNNIVQTIHPVIPNGTVITHSHNLYNLLSGATLGFQGGLQPGELLADPLFVDPSNKNFHLLLGSPAIDVAAPLGYTLDHDNNPISATAPDRGAYEYIP